MARIRIGSLDRHVMEPVVWLACLAVAAAIQFPLALNHDAAWHFEMSFRVLAGDELGRDIFDINPPMSAWLFMIPAWATEISGVSPTMVFKTFTFMVCSLSYFWTLSLLDSGERSDSRWVVALALGGALFIMPGYDFGQREHLVAALTLPYVVLAVRREQGDPVGLKQAILVGIAAAVGICVKPYFLALPLCVELWLLLRTRSLISPFRPETLSIGLFGVAYLLAVAIWAPAYYAQVVPDALSNYSGLESQWTDVLADMAGSLAFAFACVVLAALAWGDGRATPSVQAFLAAATGFLVAALLQKKGWSYQFYPAVLHLLLAAAMLYLHRKADMARFQPQALGAALMLLLSIAASSAAFVVAGHSPTGTTARVAALEQVFRKYASPQDSVFAFITSPRDIHPAVLESGRRWAGLSGVMVYMPAEINLAAHDSLKPADAARIRQVSEREDRDLLDRLSKNPPAVIAIDNRTNKLGIADRGFDYLVHFGKNRQFQALWDGYEETASVSGFRIFVRKAAIAAN